MAGLTHLAAALISKRIAPKLPTWLLIVCAYLIDIIFMMFMIAGIEKLPSENEIAYAPWSHSLLMAIIWTSIAIIIFMQLTKDKKTSIILGMVVFSHWIIDFISQPMTYVMPNSASPLLHPFEGAPELGLGVWSTEMGVVLGEYIVLIIGIIIYYLTWKKQQNEKLFVNEKNNESKSIVIS